MSSLICPNCKASNPADKTFCLECGYRPATGARLTGGAAVAGPRKPMTASTTATAHELYATLGLATAIIGGLVFFACTHWHHSWSTLSLAQLAIKGSEPLAAQYPWVSALIAALITLFLGRVLIFFHRLESK